MTIDDYHADRFHVDVTDHEMTILHDDDGYRHIQFENPGRWYCRFNLITWPGHLTITGDPGTYTFRAGGDMVRFFGQPPTIKPQYWAEKLLNPGGWEGTKEYSPDKFKEYILNAVAQAPAHHDKVLLQAAVEAETVEYDSPEDETDARDYLASFVYPDMATDPPAAGRFRFEDTCHWDLSDWSWSYLWCCHAVRWGTSRYLTAREQAAVAAKGKGTP